MVANAASVAPKLMATILVVDEDPQFCHTIVQSLCERAYDATSVAGFAEALHCLRERHYDVLLTDLHLRGGDGMDLILALREASPGTRPVLMIADATARESQRALDLGAVRVLCKPFEVEEMLQAVERAAEYAGGFWASVHGLSLVDTLQMFHLSRRSLSVHLLGAVRATLHMQDGQLVHAEYGDLQGEAALAMILKMPAGSLQTFALDRVKQTIFKDFQAVLLDQLRQLDERERDSKSPHPENLLEDDFADIDNVSPGERAQPREPLSSNMGRTESGEWLAVRPRRSPPKTLERLDTACERIVSRVDGAVACAVIDLETSALIGIHDRRGPSQDGYEVVATAIVDLFRGPSTSRIETLGRPALRGGLGSGEHALEEVQLTSKHGLHFAKTLESGHAVLLLVTNRSTSLGMGWAQLRSAIPILERLMP